MNLTMRMPQRLEAPGGGWATYEHTAKDGTTPDEVKHPDYWTNVKKQYLRLGTVIQCLAYDRISWFVELRVTMLTADGKLAFLVERERQNNAKPIAAAPTDRFLVRPGGRAGGWQIVERHTGEAVAKGLDRETAVAKKTELEQAA